MATSAEATLASAEWPAWAGRLSAEQANMRAALSWALGGHDLEAGRELAARLARWWIATGRYSEGGRFLGAALGIAGAAPPGPGPGVAGAGNRSWRSGAATCSSAWPGTRAMRTRSAPCWNPAPAASRTQTGNSRRGRRASRDACPFRRLDGPFPQPAGRVVAWRAREVADRNRRQLPSVTG
jgi:hypothetical protein